MAAIRAEEPAALRDLLRHHPELKARINEPWGPFDSPPILCVRSRALLDVLLDAGADINARSRWWAGGFGLLDNVQGELADYAISRGATVTIHAAARLGRVDRVRELLATDPALVHARGGDGQTALHVAATLEIARILLDHGAVLDATDIDHESTPAQYMVRDRQDIARELVGRGCRTDLLLVTALGDPVRVRRHLDADPALIRMRVSARWFPKQNPGSGGTIYTWTLGGNKTAHQIAREFGHQEVLALLLERTPDELKLTVGCELGDPGILNSLATPASQTVLRLSEDDRRAIAYAAERNNTAAVLRMLEIGWPVGAPGQHGGTALHWAAFHGNLAMLVALLRHNPALELPDTDYQGTPLKWALHGSIHGWHQATAEYPAVVEALLAAGALPPQEPSGSEAVRSVLARTR